MPIHRLKMLLRSQRGIARIEPSASGHATNSYE
jgi:hypothetical protein